MIGDIANPVNRPTDRGLITEWVRCRIEHQVALDANIVHAPVDLKGIVMKIRPCNCCSNRSPPGAGPSTLSARSADRRGRAGVVGKNAQIDILETASNHGETFGSRNKLRAGPNGNIRIAANSGEPGPSAPIDYHCPKEIL